MNANEVLISIVVCTCNRAGLLREAVASLTRLRTDDRFRYEIIIVDNASTDETPSVIEQLVEAESVPIRGVREVRKGVSFARNRGISEARGEWIAFFDDDQEAEPDWLLRLLELAQRRACRVVGGAVKLNVDDSVLDSLGPFAQALFGGTASKNVEQPYNRKFAPGAGNLMLHRDLFKQVGTFETSLTEGGEDTDLYRRIRQAGIDAWYTPDAVVLHKIPAERLNREHLLRTARRIGGHIARRERQTYGRVRFSFVAAARMAQAVFRDGRAWIGSRMPSGRVNGSATATGRRLDADCLVARSSGYVRTALRELFPTLFQQTRYFAGLDFHSERQPTSGARRAGFRVHDSKEFTATAPPKS